MKNLLLVHEEAREAELKHSVGVLHNQKTLSHVLMQCKKE